MAQRGIWGHQGVLGAPRGCRGCWGLLKEASGSVGVSGVYGSGKWTESPTTLGPVQCPSTPTGSPGGMTYWPRPNK